MTLSGHVVRANPSLARLSGEPVARLVAASYAELAGDDVRSVTQAVDKVASGDRDVLQLEHGVRSDPERRLLTTLSAVRDAAGHPLYLFLQVQDVSAQREVEEQLRRSEQRFKLLVEAVTDYAIFMLDPEGHIVSWNAGAQRIKGWTAAEIVGRHFRVFYPPERQAEGHPEYELAAAVRDGHYEEEGWRVRRDGSEFWAQVTITALRDEDQELVGFAKVTRDISELLSSQQAQEQSAAALAAANARLAEANVRLSDAADDQAHFLAVTAHELRSPVGVVAGSADLLVGHRHQLSEDEASELVEGIAAAAGRLRRLVDDLLAAAREHGTAIEFRPQPLDLSAQLTRTVRLMERTLDFEIRLVDVPDVRVNADPDRFSQMLENLLSNAAQHGVAPATVAVSRSGATVEIAVIDAGEGVGAAMQERLFERFATSGQGGTGLGLYIVRELARAHEGNVVYRPEDGAFVIRLPAAEPS
jgi:PAS domain S-box-containing protein